MSSTGGGNDERPVVGHSTVDVGLELEPGLLRPSNLQATCAWCHRDYPSIVALLDHVDSTHLSADDHARNGRHQSRPIETAAVGLAPAEGSTGREPRARNRLQPSPPTEETAVPAPTSTL